nr:hypothetical protein [Tanacetum cinerariifolium]
MVDGEGGAGEEVEMGMRVVTWLGWWFLGRPVVVVAAMVVVWMVAEAAVVVVTLGVVAAHGGEWYGGSNRSGDGDRFWDTESENVSRNNISKIKFNDGRARGRAYAIDGGIWYSVVSSKMNQLYSFTCAQVGGGGGGCGQGRRRSGGYVAESDPEEDPEEYKEDETEDGPVGYPMDGGDDGDDDDGYSSGYDADDEDEDEEDEEEHLALADSAVNTRVTELVELHEHDTHDLYALLEDAQDGRTRISQRVSMDSQRVDLLMEDRMTL